MNGYRPVQTHDLDNLSVPKNLVVKGLAFDKKWISNSEI